MAEEEKIMAHAKKAVQSLTNKNKKWKEKVKDFLFEILIIIVAVNITLWFHNWNDKKQEREQVKDFLINIRENLQQDTVALKRANNFLAPSIAYSDRVLKQLNENKIDAGYIDSNSNQLTNSLYITLDYGVFESFKSAGSLKLIENHKLLTGLTSLYTQYLPVIQQEVKEVLDERNSDFKKYIGLKIGVDSDFKCKLSTIIHQPEVQFLIQSNSFVLNGIKWNNQLMIDKIVGIIPEIDKELKDRFNYDVKKIDKS